MRIIINDKEMTIAEFQTAHGLHVGGWLNLNGTGIKPIGKDSRDYEFFAVRLANGPA